MSDAPDLGPAPDDGDRLDRDDTAAGPDALRAEDGWYRGVIVRVYYGSGTGTLRSHATGREFRFKFPFVEVRGPIPRIDGLREGMTVGFDVGWTSRGEGVTVIKVLD